MAATRTATVTWNGNLANGSGTVTAASSELFVDLPVSWAARTEAPDGQTSPEELLAAAHASCFSMALAGALDRAGTPPNHLHVSATVTFDPPRFASERYSWPAFVIVLPSALLLSEIPKTIELPFAR